MQMVGFNTYWQEIAEITKDGIYSVECKGLQKFTHSTFVYSVKIKTNMYYKTSLVKLIVAVSLLRFQLL